MKQFEIYEKDITRLIDGVIKAEDEHNLGTEINEYVITAELAGKRTAGGMLPGLFEALAKKDFNQSVWISGDFGSGKSHLLKILSYVLENREIKLEEDKKEKCASVFAQKAAEIDFEFEANILKTVKIPTQCMLFNIQENFEGVRNNTKNDPVLNVFLKVFNEKLGYDAKDPALADIERHIDEKGKLGFLNDECLKRYGKEWNEIKKRISLQPNKLGDIYAEIEGQTPEIATKIIQDSLRNYSLDIDGFADMVKEHLDKQASGSRFVFCVDEVGQFIANDVHRMLSLQTIAESLMTKTSGRAFLIVTSQVDMDAAVGELNKQQKYDFSRIQGRFNYKIALTSNNSDEVIQKRILLKNDKGKELLAKIYEREHNNMKTLFNFGESSQFSSDYRTVEKFQNTFPFINYQFELLKQSVMELSKNNAFTGQQQSVGERSMLSITQQIAKIYKDKDLSQIVQFGDLFEGLHGLLQVKTQSDILNAQQSLGDDELSLKVLKALFLVKYVKGFHTTLDNITKIMLPSLNTDIVDFKSQIQMALNKLELQSYIERAAGDEYNFLTNEEKDIENQIKETDLAPDAQLKELSKILYSDLYSEQKIRINNNPRLNYPFGHYIDEIQDGRDYELYLHFLTPMGITSFTNDAAILTTSMRYPNHLMVVLSDDKLINRDLITYLKAEKCLSFIRNSANDEYRNQIIIDKLKVNAERRKDVVLRLRELVSEARLFIGGQELLSINSRDIKTRITLGLQTLVGSVYTNLKMLTKDYDENLLKTIITDSSASGIFAYQMDEIDAEVLGLINRNKLSSIRSTVKGILDNFRAKPYGWYETAVECILAKLYKMNKISFRYDASLLEDRDLYSYLSSSARQQNTIIDIEESIPESKVRQLKTLFQEFFNKPSTQLEAKAIHKEFTENLNIKVNELKILISQNNYKFIETLKEGADALNKTSHYTHPYIYTHIQELEDKLLDIKEDVLDPLTSFINGPQKSIFNQVARFNEGNRANLVYADKEKIDSLKEIYDSVKPWLKIKEAKNILEAVGAQIEEKQKEEKELCLKAIQTSLASIQSLQVFASLPPKEVAIIQEAYSRLESELDTEKNIGNIIALRTSKLESLQNHIIDAINKIADSSPTPVSYPINDSSDNGKIEDVPRPRIIVRRDNALKVSFPKTELRTAEDVEEYIEAIRRNMMRIIGEDKSIML